MSSPIYEVKKIPGKGRGVFARVDIIQGTRILVERPLLTAPDEMPCHDAEAHIINRLKSLPKEQQRQYLSLQNNYPGKHIFSGIFRTNALPCGAERGLNAVYATICLINHDCMPNSNPSWNRNLNMQTIHAMCNIKAGKEITICYTNGVTTQQRQVYLKQFFGFECACSLCSLSPTERMLSDIRRTQIDRMNEDIFTDDLSSFNPGAALNKLYKLIQLLEEEYKHAAKPLISDVYSNAARVAISYGDRARTTVFAERAHKLRIICTGRDGEDVQAMERLMSYPASHEYYGLSKEWKSRKDAVPNEWGEEDFEKWLWRLE